MKHTKRVFGAAPLGRLAASCLVAAVMAAPWAQAGGDRTLKVLDGETGRVKATYTVEIARTLEEQIRGLQGREALEPDRGMIFLYDEAAPRAFWMKDVSFPLDMVFADADGRIIEIMEERPPCLGPVVRCPSYRTLEPARYVLEIAGGQAKAHGMKTGDRLELAPEGK